MTPGDVFRNAPAFFLCQAAHDGDEEFPFTANFDTEYGKMIYIGHLDIMRYFQKALRRADVDLAYTQGYNPHPILSFAAPLGVGITSCGEYADLEVNSSGSSKEMLARLNEVMVPGMEIIDYRVLPDDAKNAMSCVAAADYCLTFRGEHTPS